MAVMMLIAYQARRLNSLKQSMAQNSFFAQAAGHTAMEPATIEALVGFSEKCKTYFK